MRTIQLAEYATDGTLSEVEDAQFFARKFGTDDQLDFTGVRHVSAHYLDVLLAGHSLESLDGRVVGLAGAVDEALAAWAERQQETRPIEAEHPRSQKKTITSTPTRQTAPALEFTRRDVEGERFTPTRLVSRLKRQLTGYIESAYPLNDPTLVRARRTLLDEAAGGHLLAQEPYVETTPRYRGYDGDHQTLGLPTHLADLFSRLAETAQQYCTADDPKTLLYPGMYQHQAEAIRAFLVDGKDTIVATGTGSGKTECFLVPMLGMLYDEASSRPETFALPGVRAMILYPMNALVNDQLTRLRLLFGDTGLAAMFPKDAKRRSHPTFGMYTGRTPYPGPRDSNQGSGTRSTAAGILHRDGPGA